MGLTRSSLGLPPLIRARSIVFLTSSLGHISWILMFSVSTDNETAKTDYDIGGSWELTLRFGIGFKALLCEVYETILLTSNHWEYSRQSNKWSMPWWMKREMHSDNRRHIDESTTVYGRLWVHLYESHIYKPIISFLGYHVKSLNKTKNLVSRRCFPRCMYRPSYKFRLSMSRRPSALCPQNNAIGIHNKLPKGLRARIIKRVVNKWR